MPTSPLTLQRSINASDPAFLRVRHNDLCLGLRPKNLYTVLLMTSYAPARTRASARTHDLPYETTGTTARRLGIAISTVDAAIACGRLPAYRVTRGDGRPMYLIRPQDADQLWVPLTNLPAP